MSGGKLSEQQQQQQQQQQRRCHFSGTNGIIQCIIAIINTYKDNQSIVLTFD